MRDNILLTDRLDLRPIDPADLLLLIAGAEAFGPHVAATTAAGLRSFLVSDDVSADWLEILRMAAGPDPWVFGFVAVQRSDDAAIGLASFKGPPRDGAVEIAYGIAPGFENRGYATEAARALTDFAFTHDTVKVVKAHTMLEANASTRVLTKCGFALLGEVVDPADGPVWSWEVRR